MAVAERDVEAVLRRLSNPTREAYERSYVGTGVLYYRDQPSLDQILERLADYLERL